VKKLLIAIVAVVVLVVGGAWIYTVVDKPADKLTIDDTAGSTSDVTVADDGTTDGTWKVSSDSIVGYRIQETLFGASNTATGRTSEVDGSITINGSTVSAAQFTVDVNSISSDRTQRDGQFRGRIMETSQFPTSTFKLTSPINLGGVPELDQEITTKATGDLTLHGVTKKITFDVTAKRVSGQVRVNGAIPITFSDYGIDDPSGGPAQVGDTGTLEFTLVLTR
jgi:polyisoprenoid-binding protein YceI